MMIRFVKNLILAIKIWRCDRLRIKEYKKAIRRFMMSELLRIEFDDFGNVILIYGNLVDSEENDIMTSYEDFLKRVTSKGDL